MENMTCFEPQRNIEGGRELLSKDSDGESTKARLILFKINWGLKALVASVLVDPGWK